MHAHFGDNQNCSPDRRPYLLMIATLQHSLLAVALVAVLELAVIARILLRPHRDPASRIAWVVVVGVLPMVGMFAYLLLGEVNIGRRRVARLHAVLEADAAVPASHRGGRGDLRSRRARALSTTCFTWAARSAASTPSAATPRTLLPDSNATIDAMVADIDAAKDHVHLLFYIWLPDNNGCKVVEALKRAAARGVTCRAMADDLGSRAMIALRALAGHARGRRAAGRRACRSAIRCCGRSTGASTCATTARSSSSTTASPIAAARTAPIRSSSSRRSSRPGSTRSCASRARSPGRTSTCSPATG